ncbi:MAG: hypothetical protein LBQ68_07580 [Clostridiales bacterium]|jgi:hypothetical protein|nr:hypothetical protein [Clostridiales bacterium]
MKLHTQRKTLNMLWALLFAAGLQAQVVIGSLDSSEEAALLQIKDTQTTVAGGVTATTGGLLLPRVELSHASDIKVIDPLKVTDEKKKELTGLLVYNVNTTGELDEGIYEWDGDEWNQLEIVSETAGSSTKKAVVRASTLITNNTPTVSMGIFEFRIYPAGTDWTKMKPQYRLTKDPKESLTFWHTVSRQWDHLNPGTSVNGDFGNTSGFSYDAISRDFATANYGGWQDFHTLDLPKADFRYDIWLVDHVSNHTYNVQVFRADFNLSTPIHALLVTEY